MRGGSAASNIYGPNTSVKHAPDAGFTIIEMLIATLVFSMLLLLITAGFLRLSNQFYKGITSQKTQNTARAATDAIAQAIQFASGPITQVQWAGAAGQSEGFFCAGNQVFMFNPGVQVDDSATPPTHGLMQAEMGACPTAVDSSWFTGNSVPSNGRELIGDHMRLSNITITQDGGIPNLYNIDIKVAYGDDDLLDHPTDSAAQCKGDVGDQFCSISELNTLAESRIN